MTTSLIVLPLAAGIINSILHIIAQRDFVRLNLLDSPDQYGLKRRKLPYPTGILSVLTVLAFFACIAPWTMQNAGIMLGIFLLALLSFIDDRRGIAPWIRLTAQILIAFLIFATGSRIYTLTNPFVADGIIKLDTIDIHTTLFGPLPLISGLFTIFWLLLTTNALNWFDGIPGQVSLLSTISFLVIGALSLSDRVSQPELALIAFIVAGCSIASLFFDFPPNRVVMGDTGAMFFGLMLGILTLSAGGKVATAFLVLGVPLIDLFLVCGRRVLAGRNPMHGSMSGDHLHHRLREKGWSERHVIFLTGAMGSLFGITALFLSTGGKLVAALLLFAIMMGLTFYTTPKK